MQLTALSVSTVVDMPRRSFADILPAAFAPQTRMLLCLLVCLLVCTVPLPSMLMFLVAGIWGKVEDWCGLVFPARPRRNHIPTSQQPTVRQNLSLLAGPGTAGRTALGTLSTLEATHTSDPCH